MKFLQYLTFLLVAALALSACQDDERFLTADEVTLEFSLDTLRFDTVFTELGSATRSFKVYNRNDRPVRINKISIAGNEGGRFLMNVDGTAGDELEDIEIWENDSIYVFVETTVDPDQPLSVSPFVIEDQVVFETGEKRQSINLEAWGQNANYVPSRFNKGVPVLLSCDNETIVWDDPKPYVIYGVILVDSCVLEVAAGTHIYVHGGVAQNDIFGVYNDGLLFTLSSGSLRLLGTQEAPIVIEGDRLEEGFAEAAGQWQGIRIGRGSVGNLMEHTTIKNSIYAVYVDSLGELTARNSQFYNTTSSGVIGFSGNIFLDNCLVYNNGGNSVQFILGGNYNLRYCTVASYGVDASALYMNNYFCYDGVAVCNFLETYPLRARLSNCILFGSSRDELSLDDIFNAEEPGFYDVAFDHCIVKLDEVLTDTDSGYADFLETRCFNCINATRNDPLFADPNEDIYLLDTLSVAEMQARPLDDIPLDLDGNARDIAEPDIGCYEYQY